MKNHNYHLVNLSILPFTSSISILSLLLGSVMLINKKIGGIILIIVSIISLLFNLYQWWIDITIESTYLGEHTKIVQRGLTIGFILFVISEICLFFSLFFAYFYNAIIPSIEVGSIWPPIGVQSINYFSLPLLNTAILFFSSVTITIAHHYIVGNNKYKCILYIFITLLLGIIFTYFQYIEYKFTFYSISDSIYGSSFFILTGFHGIHVLIGTIFIIITFLRIMINHFTIDHHLGFNFSALYWHIIDLIWLFLFALIYIWGA